MLPDNMKEVAQYFNEHWQNYKDAVARNSLCHKEMLSALEQFLCEKMQGKNFSFVDVGCGDSDTIAPYLQHHALNKYIGIDIAEIVLQKAANNLSQLNCFKQFIAENMITAIQKVQPPIDLIFSSYTVHHLNYMEKFNFIKDCKSKLAPEGYFLMVDGILDENQTREEWLLAYERYYKELYPTISDEELERLMRHPRSSDYPESILTFKRLAQTQGWAHCEILLKIGLLAFLIFTK